MAKIGIKGLTYAPVTGGGDGSAVTYGTGVALNDYMIRGEISEERSDTKFYADDHSIDAVNEVTGISVTLELANMTDTMDSAFLGHKGGTGSELNVTDASSPFVGCGFYRKERFKGAITYHAFWIYKAQFSKDADGAQTKAESIDFQTESLTGAGVSVILSTGGDPIYYSHLRSTTETGARSWLNGKAGISG